MAPAVKMHGLTSSLHSRQAHVADCSKYSGRQQLRLAQDGLAAKWVVAKAAGGERSRQALHLHSICRNKLAYLNKSWRKTAIEAHHSSILVQRLEGSCHGATMAVLVVDCGTQPHERQHLYAHGSHACQAEDHRSSRDVCLVSNISLMLDMRSSSITDQFSFMQQSSTMISM